MAAFKVRPKRSTGFACGWYGVVRIVRVDRISINSLKSADVKFEPLSVHAFSGAPKNCTHEFKNVETTQRAVVLAMGNEAEKCVHMSVMFKT
jgi:hypothetical protein